MTPRTVSTEDRPELPARHDVAGAQRLRLQRLGLAVVGYAVTVVALRLIEELSLGRLTIAEWAAYIGAVTGINAVFLILIRTGMNLRFRDPSMTKVQIVSSALAGMIPLYAIPDARPLVLMFFFPAFGFGMFRLSGREYGLVFAVCMSLYGGLLIFESATDRPGFVAEHELFLFCLFGLLLGWISLFGGYVSRMRRRLQAQNRRIEREIEERRRAQQHQEALIADLRQALRKVRQLSGMLPICASCKKIRDDRGYWNQVETFIDERSEVTFSHGLCPDCREKLYPKLGGSTDE